jgi:signal recognition particle subunit SRP54
MLPGVAKMKEQLLCPFRRWHHQAPARHYFVDDLRGAACPDVLKASRKRRRGGLRRRVEDVNKLKTAPADGRHDENDGRWQARRRDGQMASMFGLPCGGSGVPQPTPEQLAALQRQAGQRRRATAGAAGQSDPVWNGGAAKIARSRGTKLPGLGGGLWSGLNPLEKK